MKAEPAGNRSNNETLFRRVSLNYTQFKKLVTVSREDVYLEALAENRASIRVKNEKKVVNTRKGNPKKNC